MSSGPTDIPDRSTYTHYSHMTSHTDQYRQKTHNSYTNMNGIDGVILFLHYS